MTREEFFKSKGGVAAFQAEVGLVADGAAGPLTNNAADRARNGCTPIRIPDASPGSDKVRRPSLDAYYGKVPTSAYPKDKIKEKKDKGRVSVDPAWEAENIVSKKLWDGQVVKLHKLVADEFDRVFKLAVEASGYHPKYIVGYKPRHTMWDPARALSTHTWGCAVDFEPDNNDLGGVDVTGKKDANGKYPPSRMRRNMKFVETFEAHGWIWGGRWAGFFDDMHWQLCFQ